MNNNPILEEITKEQYEDMLFTNEMAVKQYTLKHDSEEFVECIQSCKQTRAFRRVTAQGTQYHKTKGWKMTEKYRWDA